MESHKEVRKVGGLELVLRTADERDIGFIYELMRNHLEDEFNKIPEGWSRKKFKEGYNPKRMVIIEHENMPVGFFDLEILNEEAYCHNLHISNDYMGKGVGLSMIRYMEKIAKERSAYLFKGKVFTSNYRLLHLLRKIGYNIEELPQENSVLVKKEVKKGAKK